MIYLAAACATTIVRVGSARNNLLGRELEELARSDGDGTFQDLNRGESPAKNRGEITISNKKARYHLP